MPLVRIEVLKGRTPPELRAISDAVHRALVEVMGVPQRDRFHVIGEHDPAHLLYDPGYLDVPRTDGIVFVQIALSAGRAPELKQTFYARCAELLAEANVRPEDVLIALLENQRGDWSFGRGEAQYLTLPKERWK